MTKNKLSAKESLEIMISWLEDNINCKSEIIFDNDYDNTDSEKILPGLIQALEIVKKSN
ncbi:hypothetical protein QMI71_004657 [Salmonella enterica]|nr:hypothetical protein [Salmonella enterica]